MERDILLIGTEHIGLYQDACKELNVKIRTANDLKGALDAIQEIKSTLILVDHEVLGKKSLEICQTLKKYPGTQAISLLFIVPGSDLETLSEMLFIPINDYIFLPLDAKDFRMRLSAQFALAKLKEEKTLTSVKEKIEELEKLVQIFPNFNAAWEELAEIYERLGRIDDALKALLKLSKEYYHQSNFGLSMNIITKMKAILAKQSATKDRSPQFMESLNRCLQILK